MHGKQSILRFEGKSPIYEGLEDGQPVMRYHSILIEEMPEDFEVTARAADDNSIMAIQHKSLPIYGFSIIQKVLARRTACRLSRISSI